MVLRSCSVTSVANRRPSLAPGPDCRPDLSPLLKKASEARPPDVPGDEDDHDQHQVSQGKRRGLADQRRPVGRRLPVSQHGQAAQRQGRSQQDAQSGLGGVGPNRHAGKPASVDQLDQAP